MNTITATQAAQFLMEHDNFLILTHVRPDGDTIGCAAGLCRALRRAGKTAHVLENPGATSLFTGYLEGLTTPNGDENRTVVSVDIAARSLFPDNAQVFLDRVDLAIDHHPSQEFFAKNTCLDSGKAACGQIVFEILKQLIEITPDIALPLYVAVSTDCGCFQYSNTDAAIHRTAAALMETGIDAAALNKRHFRTKSAKRLALEADLLSNMEFFHDGQGVFLTVPISLMEHVQATEDDAEDLSALAGIIQGVDCGAVLRQLAPNTWKLSLRTGENQRVNATCACQLLGGGGHAMAAGATIDGPLPEVKARVLEAINQVKKF